MSGDKDFLDRLTWKEGDLRVLDPETGEFVPVGGDEPEPTPKPKPRPTVHIYRRKK
jgi:hypothetical protein